MAVSIQDFEAEATSVLKELRRSVAMILGDLRPCGRASELSTELELDRSLGWKIWSLAQGGATNPSPKHVPGRNGFRAFLDAARKAGASTDHLGDARRAFERFEALSRAHARDRATAEIMLGALTPEGRSRLELSLRRAAFRANAHFLGVRADTLYQADMIIAGEGGSMPSIARVRSHYGLTRMRAGVRWVLGRSAMVTPGGKTTSYARRPLEVRASALDAPIVGAFSSRPTPGVVRHLVDGVVFQDELEPGPVGKGQAVDIVTAELIDNIPASTDHKDAVTAKISTPCERFCYDVLLHHSIAERGAPTVEVFTTIHSDLPYTFGDRDRVPVTETIEHMGRADSTPPAPEIPHHADLIRWAIGASGQRLRDFEVYRLRMRFPPIPTVAAAAYLWR